MRQPEACRPIRIPRFFHRRGVSLVLVLVLSVLGFLPQLAHASSFVGYAAANVQTQTACTGAGSVGGCFTCSADGGDGSKCGTGSVFQSPLTGQIIAASLTVGDVVPNQIVIATFPVGQVPSTTLTGPPCNGQNGPCLTVNSGQSFTVKDVEGVSGLATFTFSAINLANPISVTQNQYVAVLFTKTSGGGASPHGLVSLCSSNCPSVTNTFDSCVDFGTISPLVGTAYSEVALANCGPGLNIAVGATFGQSSVAGTTITTTTCYGNCGNPAVTLANTNSTHSINFNQSLTLLYEFQSNVNGFVLNVTTSVAKSYNNGLVPTLGIYVIPSCPQGQIPFSNSCPANAILTGSPIGTNPPKGKLTLTASNGQIPVLNGQWVALGVTSTLGGFDINDTNTNVALFQTAGMMPAAITQTASASSLCAGCKMSLYAYIIGNVVTGAGPSQPPQLGCGPGLDCILTNVVNSFCSVVSSTCQTSSSIFWTIILTIVTIMVVSFCFSTLLPGVNLGRVGLGELSVLVFIMWIVIFTSFSLLSIYVLIVVFFAVTALSARTIRGAVGI